MGWLSYLFKRRTPKKGKSLAFQEGHLAFQDDFPVSRNPYWSPSNRELGEAWEAGWNHASTLRLEVRNRATGFLDGIVGFFKESGVKQLIVGAILAATIGTWLVWFSAYIQRNMAEDEIMKACRRTIPIDTSTRTAQECYDATILNRGGSH
ncbi:MAG: hypothetical protein E6J89_18365 [Deltaproteobacteria bacterium]|nr:MAG: hypothetical protein E6J89_18365 [Deltaproteobacteria bacterium]